MLAVGEHRGGRIAGIPPSPADRKNPSAMQATAPQPVHHERLPAADGAARYRKAPPHDIPQPASVLMAVTFAKGGR